MAKIWKRVLSILLTAVMLMSVSGCGKEDEEPSQPTTTPEEQTLPE